MAIGTSVPQIEFTDTGLVLPTDPALLAGVQADWNAACGGNLKQDLRTPQGQLASSEAAIISAQNDLFAYFVSQVNPDNAQGFMQNAIARIYFITRKEGAPTTVPCVCTGPQFTTIPAGALAEDTSGNQYECLDGGTIDASGSILLTFVNVLDGPIACPENTLVKIKQQSGTGWESINNLVDGVMGNDVESTAAFAFRRQQSVALNATGSTPALLAAVFAVSGVIDAIVIDNPTGAPVSYGPTGYVLAPHSVYVGVTGGSDQDVAQAIWLKKDLGCSYNGNTTIAVQDTASFAFPYPVYQVTFNRMTPTPFLFAVQLVNNPNMPASVIELAKTAIVNAFVGASGVDRARAGSRVIASPYYKALQQIDPTVQPLSVLLGIATPTLTNLLLGIDQEPTINRDNIAVTLI